MKGQEKTEEKLIEELGGLRQRIVELESSESEAKKTGEALLETHSRYIALVNNVLDELRAGVFVLDKNFRVVWANQTLERYFGLEREKIIGRDKRQLVREQIKDIFEDPDDFARKVLDTYDNNTYLENFECHVLPKDTGQERWLALWSQPIESGLYTGGRIEHYYDITARKLTQERINHLNRVLRAIRNVNQLVVKEKDRHRLLQGVCDTLIENRGYYNAWIVLFDESGKLVANAEAGFGKDFFPMLERLKRGELTECGRKALKQSEVVVTEYPKTTCTDCSLANKYHGRAGMTVKLESDEKVYGLLSVSIPRNLVADKEEQNLFKEVAGDITYALHNIDLEENRKRMYEALNESEKDLKARDRISKIFLTVQDDEIYGEVLQFVLETTKSKYGIFGYIDENEALVCPSLTRDIWDQCQVPDKDIVFPREKWGGIWGKALTQKKALFSNKLLKVPEGHIPITRAMDVPILYQKKLIGNFTVGNKETDYSEKDRELLVSIADYIAPVLQARLQRDRYEKERKKAAKKIKGYSQDLERRVEKRTKELNRALYDTEEARDKIDGILKSIGDCLIVTDIYNRVILMNRAAEDRLGARLSEVIDRPIDFAIKEKTLKGVIKETLEKKEAGTQFDFELPGENTEHPRIMRARTSVIEDKNGVQTGIITIMHDVTYEREVDRLKTEFISIAAHELRTPLISIQGFSEILLTREDIKEEEKRKFLSYINKQSMNLTKTINTLLDISRIESGRGFTLDKALCDINEIIRETVGYFQVSSPRHQFEIVLPEGPVELIIDKEKMRHVLENILGNAIKYSPKGGLIRVTGELAEDLFQVSIEDQGMGMPPDQTEKIFDRFYRVDTTDTSIPGIGLGMSIVKDLVGAHGGKVWAESALGKGTTVQFTIPIGV